MLACPVRSPGSTLWLLIGSAGRRPRQAARTGVMLTSRAIAHMKAASSRAIAVATTVDFLPLRDSVRNRSDVPSQALRAQVVHTVSSRSGGVGYDGSCSGGGETRRRR